MSTVGIAGEASLPASLEDTAAMDAAYRSWVIQRSFELVLPVVRMGFWLVALLMLAFDSAAYFTGLWREQPLHREVALWHCVMLLFFGAVWFAYRRVQTPSDRERVLYAFIALSVYLITWFSFISWHLSGDLSIQSIALLVMACIYVVPGHFRKWVLISSTIVLNLALVVTDRTGSFIGQGCYINLIAMAVVAFLMDGYMQTRARAYFQEKCRAEIERRRADDVLYNALPASIADELKQNKTVKAEKFQQMTVLFADLVGFTQFANKLPPDAVIHVLNDIFSEFDALVDQFGVEKIKTIGDAYMVVGKGDPRAVIDLAFAMIKAINAYNALSGVELSLRIGVHRGPTVAGVIGLKRFLYDVWGDAVNTASRLESSGAAGRIHVSEAIHEVLQDQFQFECRGDIELKGKGATRTYFVLPA